MRILIVEDDPFVVDMYRLKFEEAGFEVDVASDGKRGLEKIYEGGHDAVVLDIVLPIMDGFELLQTLKREGASHPPILLLSNLGQKEDVERGLLLGAADYVIKAHFTPTEVVEKLETLLKKSKKEKHRA